MISWLNSLLGDGKLILKGVAEAHPASLLNNALYSLGVDVRDMETGKPVGNDFLDKMSRDPGIERDYWADWKDYVVRRRADPLVRYEALKQVERAEYISLKERQMVETMELRTLYMEGCTQYPSSVIGLVARNSGANVVHLDEGFHPYVEWQESGFKKDLSEVQRGRESHWLRRVLENKPKGVSLLIAGRNHLVAPSAEDVDRNPSRAYIGKFPQMLDAYGIRFSLYADLSRAEKPHSYCVSFATARM
jgi:hypothetical protein